MSFLDEYGTERPRIRVQADYGRDVPPLGRKLLDTISGSESSGYDIMYGGGRFSDYADHPRRDIPITTGPNAGKTSSAAGRYQFLGSTWDEVAKEAGLKDFSPRNQDLGAWHLAQKTYKSKTGRDLLADLESGQNVNEIGKSLSGVWTSLPGGIEPNRATDSFAARFGGDASQPARPSSLSFVGSAQAAEGPRKTSGLFDDVLGETPAAAPRKTSGLFDDVLGAEPVPINREPIPTTGFAPSGNIKELETQLRRAADEKLAGVAGGGTAGELGTASSQFLNTALFNIPRNAMAALVSKEHGIPFDEAYQMLKDIDAAGDRLNPKSSWAGFGAGIVAGAAAPGLSAARAIGPAERALTAGLTAGGYGAISEFFDTKDPEKAAIAGALGVALGTVAAPVAGKIVDLVSSFIKRGKTGTTFLKPDGTLTDEAAAAAREAGIDPADLTKVMQAKYAEKFQQKGATPAAAREALGDEFGMRFSRGEATGDLKQRQWEEAAAKGAKGFFPARTAQAAQQERIGAIDQARTGFQERFAGEAGPYANPSEAATVINAEVAQKAAQARAARNAAEQGATLEAAAARQAAEADATAARQAAEGKVTATRQAAEAEATALRSRSAQNQSVLDETFAGGRPPIERMQDVGEEIGEKIRDTAAASKARYKEQWESALSREGEFSDLAFRDIGERIRRDVTAKTQLEVTPELTPNANGALIALDRKLAELRFQNRAIPGDAEGRTAGFIQHPGEPVRMGGAVQEPGQIAGVTLRGMDTARKIMGQYFARALSSGDKTDIRATRQIMDSFINDVETSISTGLFKGDPGAWPALKEAISSFRKHQQNFYPQYNDAGAGRAMKQIIDQKATPEEIANMFLGYGRAGEKGLPVQLFDHMERVFGKDNEIVGATRQAMWEKISQVRNAAGDVDPMKSAKAISDYADSTLAKRMNTPGELDAMRRHAAGLRSLETLIESRASTRAAEEAKAAYPGQVKEIGTAEKARLKEIETTQKTRTGEAQAAYDDRFGSSVILRKMADGTATPGETASMVLDTLTKQPGNAARMIKAIENITGKDSEAVNAVRQGMWQKLTSRPEGVNDFGPQAMSQRIFKFVGSDVAQAVYSKEDLSKMTRFAVALKTAVPPNSNPSGSAWTLMRESGILKSLTAASGLSSLAWFAGHPVAGTAIMTGTVATMLARRSKANRSFGGGAPTQTPPRSDRPAVVTGAGVGLGVGQQEY